jgi:diadenosine tetraphosphate (Ap4A) HIT family hydrolase
MDFTLDPRLEADTLPVGDLPLSRVLLMNAARFPWLVLVPRRAAATGLGDLSREEAATLMGELRIASQVLRELARPDRIDVACLAADDTMLHWHVVGRFVSDPAWPGPIAGSSPGTPYPPHAAAALIDRAAALFAEARE